MDISILIPVFNFDVTMLVEKLLREIRMASLNAEVILLDDNSDNLTIKKKNEQLRFHPEVIFLKEKKNQGRSKARNKLFQEANSEYLIFLDADTRIEKENFIQDYFRYIRKHQVIVGGHYYQKTPPQKRYLLNWRYAIKREVRNAQERNEHPYDRFISMNFCIQKEVLAKVQFPDNLKGWGHEDTYFGFELERKNIDVLHIENPVLHLGLNENADYLAKQEQAIDQALELKTKDAAFNFQLLRLVQRFKWMQPLLTILQPFLKELLKKSVLFTCSPTLMNIYKLHCCILKVDKRS